jgi:addiction module HigA family antidote
LPLDAKVKTTLSKRRPDARAGVALEIDPFELAHNRDARDRAPRSIKCSVTVILSSGLKVRTARSMLKLSIITRRHLMARTPIHPGEHLAEELKGLRISAAELSRQIDVPVNRITAIINGQRSVTADTALRLGHWFGTSPEFWLNLQKLYELRLAREELGDRVEKLPTLTNRRMHHS